MKNSLMLIESPNKVVTISRYLGSTNIDIYATIGHIRELDEKSYGGFGFDPNTYEMKWKNDSVRTFKSKTYDVIEEINRRADKSESIYLSTDPDREGEAIAWHIYEILTPKNKKKCKRVVFNEITAKAINQALENPRELDQGQIESYWARKILDRGLGFKLSDFARKSIGGESAGRVQSIALKFLSDKYQEILDFVPVHWFNVFTKLENGLELTLKEVVNFSFEEGNFSKNTVDFVREDEIQKFIDELSDYFVLVKIDDPKRENQFPTKPFKTSTMQSIAINKLGLSVSNVDRIAQKLYEGVNIDGEAISLITYPRTDREDLSETFIEEAKTWIKNDFGDKYVGVAKNKKSKKDVLVQGAHEAIRPTYIHITPDELEGKLDKNELRLYRLIWLRAAAFLMNPAINENVLYHFENNGHLFVANNKIEIFDGFKAIFRKYGGEKNLEEDEFPILSLNEKYKSDVKEVKRVDKKPPSPYTESTLIKSLEEEGIGRPSTYSHIVNIVLKREYAVKEEGKLMITDLGIRMSKELEKFFPNIMKYDYTRNMEQELDNISENKSNWKKFLDGTFLAFNEELYKAIEQVKNMVMGKCPECGGNLKTKYSAKIKRTFIGCDGYPNCRYIKSGEDYEPPKPEAIGEKCPECSGDLVKKINKWNNPFICCSGYPDCKYIRKEDNEIGRDCPDCGGALVKRMNKWKKAFISCSKYPKCKYVESLDLKEETGELCPECSSPLWKLMSRFNKPYIKCSSSSCQFSKSFKSSVKKEKEGK